MDFPLIRNSKYGPGTLRDLSGARFGYLVVQAHDRYENHETWWICRCDCGRRVETTAKRLVAGRKKSCGVEGHRFKPERVNRAPSVIAGRESEYGSWRRMFERCGNPKNESYPDYGGRGISVCDRWSGRGGFARFFEDLGPKPAPAYTIERIDNYGNYEPGNCRWATKAEQRRNMRCSVYVEYRGERVLLMDLCDRVGVRRGAVYNRLKLGWDLERALSTPIGAKRVDTTAPLNVDTTHEDAGRGEGVHPEGPADDPRSGADSPDPVCRVGGRRAVEI